MKSFILKHACVRCIAVVILLYANNDVRAQSSKTIKLNENAFAFAAQLIKEGRVIADRKGAWSGDRPSADEENEFIRLHGFGEYAKWHLGIDERYPENTKRRYKFPYGDFKSVHRCGLLAVKARAHQYGYIEIENAAADLERAIIVKAAINPHFEGGHLEHRPPGLYAQRSCTPLKSEQRVSNPLTAQAKSLCSDPICANLWR
jgi:hypothetical protein